MAHFTDKDLAELDAHIKKHGTIEGFKRAPRRAAPSNEESLSQKAVVRWWRMAANGMGRDPMALMSIPNGGLRTIRTAARMRDEGAVPGAPDLFLFIPNHHTLMCGLAIEMKTTKGVVSDAQKQVHDMLRRNRYAVEICRSSGEAIVAILKYLEA